MRREIQCLADLQGDRGLEFLCYGGLRHDSSIPHCTALLKEFALSETRLGPHSPREKTLPAPLSKRIRRAKNPFPIKFRIRFRNVSRNSDNYARSFRESFANFAKISPLLLATFSTQKLPLPQSLQISPHPLNSPSPPPSPPPLLEQSLHSPSRVRRLRRLRPS